MPSLCDDDLTPVQRNERIAYLRSLSDEERSRMAMELTQAERCRIIEEIRSSHPGFDEEELRLALFERLYGKELVDLLWRDPRPVEQKAPRIEELVRNRRQPK